VLLMTAFYLLHAIVDFELMSMTATSMGIAIINTVFKVAATTVLAPMAKLLEKIALITIKDKSSEEDDEFEENLLDERFLNYPPLALEQSGKTMEQMTFAAFKNLRKSMELLTVFSSEKHDKILSREEKVDRFEDSLGAYLVRLNAMELSEKETRTAAKYLTCLSNVERISDHAVNLAELAQELADKRICFSEQAARELKVCMDAVLEILMLTDKAVREDDPEAARMVEPLEEVIDILTRELKGRHIQRVQAGNCTLELGFIFNDCLNNFERVADHCSNLAVSVLESADEQIHAHRYLRSVKQDGHEDYRSMLTGYANKYYDALSETESVHPPV